MGFIRLFKTDEKEWEWGREGEEGRGEGEGKREKPGNGRRLSAAANVIFSNFK